MAVQCNANIFGLMWLAHSVFFSLFPASFNVAKLNVIKFFSLPSFDTAGNEFSLLYSNNSCNVQFPVSVAKILNYLLTD